MSKIKEALLTNNYIDLGFDTTDTDYQYEMWLEQQQLEEEYYDSLNDKCEYSGLPSVESYNDEIEDKTFKQKSKWTKVKRNSSSKYE